MDGRGRRRGDHVAGLRSRVPAGHAAHVQRRQVNQLQQLLASAFGPAQPEFLLERLVGDRQQIHELGDDRSFMPLPPLARGGCGRILGGCRL